MTLAQNSNGSATEKLIIARSTIVTIMSKVVTIGTNQIVS